MREIAEKQIEAELQEMKKNYVPRTPAKKDKKTLAEQLKDEVEEPVQENFLVAINNDEFDTAKKSVLSDMPFNPQDRDELWNDKKYRNMMHLQNSNYLQQ